MINEQPNQESGESPAFVPVMVPADLVTEVYGFIASRATSTAALSSVPSGATARPADAVVWELDQLEKLAASTFTTIQRLGLVLDRLATSPGSWIPTSELVNATGLSRDQVQAIWTKLSRHLAKHYTESAWPLTAQWGPDASLPTAQTYYMLGDEQAKRWKAIRANA